MPHQQKPQSGWQIQQPSTQLEALSSRACRDTATLETCCEVDGSDEPCTTSSCAEEERKTEFENTEIQHENFNRIKRDGNVVGSNTIGFVKSVGQRLQQSIGSAANILTFDPVQLGVNLGYLFIY